jgi:hypothetical protein
MRIDQAAFAAAGMRLGSARARDFARALGGAVEAVLAAPAARTGSYGAWAWYAVDLALGSLAAAETGALAADLGLAPPADAAGACAADRTLRRRLRDRLVDVLRLAAAEPGHRPRTAPPSPMPAAAREASAAA